MLVSFIYLFMLGMGIMLNITLALYAWKYRQIAGAQMFAWVMLAGAEIIVSFLVLSLAPSLDATFFSLQLRIVGLSIGPVILLIFTLDYTRQQYMLSPVLRLLLFVIPIITQIVAWIFPDQFFADWTPVYLEGIVTATVRYTGWFSVHLVYGFLVMIVSLVVLIHHALQVDRSKVGAVFYISAGVICSAFFINLPITVGPEPGFRLTPLGIILQSVGMTWALVRYDFLRVTSFAYDLIFQSMKDPVLVVDKHNIVIEANPAVEVLFQRTRGTFISQPIHELDSQLPERIPTERWWDAPEVKINHSTYTVTQESIARSRYQVGTLIILRDISELKQAEDQRVRLAVEQQRVQTLHRFIGDVTHDLMTPLTIIKTSLFLAEKVNDEDQRQEYLHRMDEQSGRLQQMLEDMLLMSGLDEMHTPDPKSYDVNFSVLLENLTENHQQLAAALNHSLSFDALAGTMQLPISTDDLLAVVSRLLDNALEYTDPGGKIRVFVKREAALTSICVSDNGPGISAEDLPHIFDRFYRGAIHRPTNSGSGLGLSIARQIAELHGGHIEVETAVGQGSTFCVQFPRSSQD